MPRGRSWAENVKFAMRINPTATGGPITQQGRYDELPSLIRHRVMIRASYSLSILVPLVEPVASPAIGRRSTKTSHSGLMFAALMIGHHFSISAFCRVARA